MQSASCETSAITAIESLFPIFSISLATLSVSSLLRALTTIPEYVSDFAKDSAIARPIPLSEPVMTATLPLRFLLLCILASLIRYSSAPEYQAIREYKQIPYLDIDYLVILENQYPTSN